MPSRIFVYTTGKTIRNEIKTDKFLDGIQIRHKIINEATGVAFMTMINGSISTSTAKKAQESAARTVPRSRARENPRMILPKLNATDFQKSDSTISSVSLFITETGDARRISCFSHILVSCQTMIHTAAARILYNVRCFLTRSALVIEVLIWQLASDGFRILLI